MCTLGCHSQCKPKRRSLEAILVNIYNIIIISLNKNEHVYFIYVNKPNSIFMETKRNIYFHFLLDIYSI